MTEIRPRVLVVDDEPAIGRLLEKIFGPAGFDVTLALSAKDALEAAERTAPDVCILDMSLPDMDGLKLLARLKERNPDAPAVMLTGDGAVEHATAAMRMGAFDYLVKPPDREKLLITVRNALTAGRQAKELMRLRAQVREACTVDRIVGSSARIMEAKALARRFAESDATVLVRGESGTGKELFAQAIHFSGPRAKGPFIDINCAAMTESLLESEIFGHEKGAFTGAASRHIGKFEQAHGGTIFLDEIGDMPLPTQAKLLRVLQERSFQRVGGAEKVAVDVRVVSATNQPLEKIVAEGKFRQDLFYRINTVTLEIPPLREWREDIAELTRHFMAQASRQERRAIAGLSPEALRILTGYGWPGNVRELENVVRRAVVMCDGPQIEAVHLPAQLSAGAPGVSSPGAGPASERLIEAVEALERSMIVSALDREGWVKARAARRLGLTERILAYKIDSYGLHRAP